MNRFFSSKLEDLCAKAESIAEEMVLPNAEHIDSTFSWPAQNLKALADGDLMGLTVPAAVPGGHGQRLLGVAALTEIIGKACSSTALCFGMHCVGTAVIAAKATRHQQERYLTAIAAGRHITSLALSEPGSGANLYVPETDLKRQGDVFVVCGTKVFVTSGGYADSYVISTVASGEAAPGEFNCLVLDRDTAGMHWSEPWRGLGMRGNASRRLTLENVHVPVENLLGREGEQTWYVFEVVSPFFLAAMAGTYLGIAQAAFDIALQHVKSRSHSHSRQTVADFETVQYRVGELWADIQKSRLLLYEATSLSDADEPNAMASLFSCKAHISDMVVRVTDAALALCGGIAYGENSRLARLLRDARASHVMAPTTDLLKIWTGRTILGLPLL